MKDWVDWCDKQGGKLIDETNQISDVLAAFVIPKPVTSRPPYPLLAVEWPIAMYAGVASLPHVEWQNQSHSLLETELIVNDYSADGPFRFSLKTPSWELPYTADVDQVGAWTYSAVAADAQMIWSRRESMSFSDWLVSDPPAFLLAGDRLVFRGMLYEVQNVSPFDRAKLTALTWTNINLHKESQGTAKDADSIQYATARYLEQTDDFDVLLDDDGSGEIADLVGLRATDSHLIITFGHCKVLQIRRSRRTSPRSIRGLRPSRPQRPVASTHSKHAQQPGA